jgi:peroxiredoxin
MPDNLSVASKQEFGQPVADFSLASIDGSGERALQDYLNGKSGALVVFWSAICAHCVRYDRYFNAFAELHPQLGFVAIASRYGETRKQMQAAIDERNLRFPILLDPSGAIALEWRAQQTPRCYLIAADRGLQYRGAIDNFKLPEDNEYLAYLEPAVAAFLASEPIARPETASFGCAIQTVYYQLPKQL